jgi:hypothetical protein
MSGAHNKCYRVFGQINIFDEEHFVLYCNRYDSLRKSVFSDLNINSDYCDTNHVHVDRTLSTFRCLLNPIGIQETKTICHFIQSAFSIHCTKKYTIVNSDEIFCSFMFM